jgi:Zn finger protein HypA/HybF involved in hydrogenase expression
MIKQNPNPFMDIKNEYEVKDMFIRDKRILRPCLLDKIPYSFECDEPHYDYLLEGINTKINWNIIFYCWDLSDNEDSDFYFGNSSFTFNSGTMLCIGNLDGKIYFTHNFCYFGYSNKEKKDGYNPPYDSINFLQHIQDDIKENIVEFPSINYCVQYLVHEYYCNEYRLDIHDFLIEISNKYENIIYYQCNECRKPFYLTEGENQCMWCKSKNIEVIDEDKYEWNIEDVRSANIATVEFNEYYTDGWN